MNKIEYIAEVLPDSHLSLPSRLAKQLNLKVNSKVRILLIPDEHEKKGINCFFGKWQDERDADDIVSDIYKERKINIRPD